MQSQAVDWNNSQSLASPSSSSQYWVAEGVTVWTPDSEGMAVINLVCPENSRSNRWLKSGWVPSIILGISVLAAKKKTSLLKEALGTPLESDFQVCAEQDFRKDECSKKMLPYNLKVCNGQWDTLLLAWGLPGGQGTAENQATVGLEWLQWRCGMIAGCHLRWSW